MRYHYKRSKMCKDVDTEYRLGDSHNLLFLLDLEVYFRHYYIPFLFLPFTSVYFVYFCYTSVSAFVFNGYLYQRPFPSIPNAKVALNLKSWVPVQGVPIPQPPLPQPNWTMVHMKTIYLYIFRTLYQFQITMQVFRAIAQFTYFRSYGLCVKVEPIFMNIF